ncbi:tetratricopeptide repeat protein [Streptomonospora nanhaiensis]|uniref:Putative ATPase/DNA-binding NarL/FixJ family response regulator n=1 Tax=Streptomonospora nanhaiensis TaxID=1323731 RepID=A0A853BV88_9ACTN|nr:tetratricopeptide repeat protein [Streptomonospora nanhaiensis]MBV2365824.1 LuxR C-terminal-related transcriptional regulator [Streptomonospora nanhaiensis]MBX9390330.1 LuxR C-terminal-related transcriptional regulator [Streptomonospora nanhaiensis]NYI98142.1 putative ATPase/DNA-binding NarL/FixJ family response regulator [Streptomonospora nanhaiensis]
MTHPRPTPSLATGPRPGDMVGRERDVAELCRILGQSRLVSLTGSGGMGKTLLAVRVSDLVRSRFTHGSSFVDLSEAATPDQVVRAVGRSLRVLENSQRPPLEAIVTALRHRSVLLLLDTCERAVAALAELCRVLLDTCPGVRILATSRQPLRIPGETVWRVPPLSLPPPPRPSDDGCPPAAVGPDQVLRYEAVRLFAARAARARPGFRVTADNAAAIASVCRMLDGVPLAIELAAARVRVLSVHQILSRLDDRFRLLVTAGSELPARQRTLRAVLEWSHDLLVHPEQLLLRRLTVFGTWNGAQAARVCGRDGVDPAQVGRLLESLRDKSLIVLDCEVGGDAYYRLPDTVRAYAAERLAAAGEEAATWQHCLSAAVAEMEDMAEAVARPLTWAERLSYLHLLDHHRENTARLLEWALRQGRAEEGLRLCVALRPYWFARGLLAEGSRSLRRLLWESPETQPPHVRARALAVHAELCLDLEGARTAASIATTALDTARACGDTPAAVVAWGVLAAAALRAGDDRGCREAAERALARAAAVPDHFTEVSVLGTLGRLARRSGDLDTAEKYLDRGVEAAEKLGDLWCVARCLNGLGVISTERGDLDVAAGRLDRAMEIFGDMGVAPETARCSAAMGYLDLARGDISGARRRFAGCLRISAASGRRAAAARALEALAELAIAEEQPERAASLAGVAARLYAALRQPYPRAERLFAAACRTLPADVAQQAWKAWRTLPLDQVVERAASFPVPRRPLPALLTPREREIAVLVGEGMSNRQIARHLTISQATVARHIANIFRKLLITSRAQLADWAAEHGLNR